MCLVAGVFKMQFVDHPKHDLSEASCLGLDDNKALVFGSLTDVNLHLDWTWECPDVPGDITGPRRVHNSYFANSGNGNKVYLGDKQPLLGAAQGQNSMVAISVTETEDDALRWSRFYDYLKVVLDGDSFYMGLLDEEAAAVPLQDWTRVKLIGVQYQIRFGSDGVDSQELLVAWMPNDKSPKLDTDGVVSVAMPDYDLWQFDCGVVTSVRFTDMALGFSSDEEGQSERLLIWFDLFSSIEANKWQPSIFMLAEEGHLVIKANNTVANGGEELFLVLRDLPGAYDFYFVADEAPADETAVIMCKLFLHIKKITLYLFRFLLGQPKRTGFSFLRRGNTSTTHQARTISHSHRQTSQRIGQRGI